MNLLIPEVGAHGAVGEHVHHVEIGAALLAAFLAFPGVKRPPKAVFRRLFPRPVQGFDAVAQKGFGDFRLGVHEHGKEEHFRIPEDGPLVGLAGKPPGRNGHALRVARGHAVQMILAGVQEKRRFFVPLQGDFGLGPNRFPGVKVRLQAG